MQNPQSFFYKETFSLRALRLCGESIIKITEFLNPAIAGSL
jgi:hypothetical protein